MTVPSEDKRSPGFTKATKAEYQSAMHSMEKRTVPYEFGFIKGPHQTDNDAKPLFMVDDSHFPFGNPNVDVAIYNFQCQALGYHVFFDFEFISTRTQERRQFYINICPFEVYHNPILSKQMELLASMGIGGKEDNESKRVVMFIMGKQMADFFRRGMIPSPPTYHKLSGHAGKFDISPLVLTLVTLRLDYPPRLLSTAWSRFCMYCRKHSPSEPSFEGEPPRQGGYGTSINEKTL
jgi:hypothetical protein